MESTLERLVKAQKIAKKQAEYFDRHGEESATNWVSFVFNGTAIHDPFMDESGRFEVHPIVEYGDAFLNSGFMN